MKSRDADIPISENVFPAEREIGTPMLASRFINSEIRGDRQWSTKPAIARRKRALTKTGQEECAEGPVIGEPLDTDHWLTQFVLLVDVLDLIGLIDDIDQMARFRDAPEDAADTEPEGPGIGQMLPAGLTNIEMAAFPIVGVDPQEWDDGQAVIRIVPIVPKFGRSNGGE